MYGIFYGSFQSLVKSRFFVWKALHGTVPGKAILAACHIPVAPICPICKGGPEDIRHLLFTCNRAREVWHALGLEELIDNALVVDRLDSVILEYILYHPTWRSPIWGGVGLQESILIACWYTWWQRREMVKGESVAGPPRTAFAIEALTANYEVSSHTSAPHEISWTKPRPGCYKLNTDVHFMIMVQVQ
uniref:Reverse transcriptase zinc-binding domain-containing protein n=1 Tax=Triticum urartu TaxID=4572 RepID=A0A8R7R0X7_TRIUA